MLMPKQDKEAHFISDEEVKVFRVLDTAITPMFLTASTIFMEGVIAKGICPKVAAKAYAAMICTNLARISAIASGTPCEIVSAITPELVDIGFQCQQLIGHAVNDIIDNINKG